MFKKIAAVSLLAIVSTGALAESCMDIGGVALAHFFDEGEGKPLIISGGVTGSFSNAAGKITAQRKTETGLEMDIEHYFGRTDGGSVLTRDLGVLTAVPGKPGRFMIEITYDIQKEKSRGTLKGYDGGFISYGLVDLRDGNDLKGLVRYEGKICKS
jgi:hypothetical protein